MRKFLIYCSFIFAILVVFAIFLTTKTYAQLAVAIILYPLLAFFAFKVFQGETQTLHGKPTVSIQLPSDSAEKIELEIAKYKKENMVITDIDKRAFLKMLGGIGVSAIVFSFINKKFGGLFSGNTATALETVSLKNSFGQQIDPVEKTPTDGYRITEIDDSSSVTYFGFTDKDGSWYIMRQDTDAGAFRYSRGTSNFSRNWNDRENLRYEYYNDVFTS